MDLFTIPLDGPDGTGKLILYRPLAGLAFVGNQAMANLTRRLVKNGTKDQEASEPLKFLQRVGFLDPDPAPPPPAEGDFIPTTAVLLLTNQCQLRCTYCYASAGELALNELTLELGKVAIEQVCLNARKLGRTSFAVSFHGGGEPTLAWNTLQECASHAREQGLPANISLTTNGIWSTQKTAWLMDHLDDISLSMDGDPQTQDHNRPYVNGRGSSNGLMRTIAALDRRKFRYGIRMTATAPWEDFPRNVRFLCERTGCPSMQVEPAFNTQRGEHRLPEAEEARRFGEAFLDAFDIATHAGRQLSYSGVRLGKLSATFCTAPYQALVVNADGDLVACYEVTNQMHPLAGLSVIGRIEAGQVKVDEAARGKLHQKMRERREGCRECASYWCCAGDCYTRSFLPGEKGHLRYGARCELNRYLLKELLLRAIAQGDGLWRRSNMQVQAPANPAIPIKRQPA
jgi:uncharacterized protein